MRQCRGVELERGCEKGRDPCTCNVCVSARMGVYGCDGEVGKRPMGRE